MEDVVEVEEPISARKQWGGPSATVLNALKNAPLSETAETLGSTVSDEGDGVGGKNQEPGAKQEKHGNEYVEISY